MELLYLIVAFAATFVGAITGFGGGVIIKPSLDAIGQHDAATIAMLSSFTVLVMSAISSMNYLKNGINVNRIILVILFGSVAGGFAGKFLFGQFYQIVSDTVAKQIQSLLLIAMLTFVLFRKRLPSFETKSQLTAFIAGVLLGMLSSFLGIGGGPFNVAVLCMLLPITMKDAAAYSIYSIFLATSASLILSTVTTGFAAFDLSMLWFMLPAGIAGGFLGSLINRKMKNDYIRTLYMVVNSGLIVLNVYNLFRK